MAIEVSQVPTMSALPARESRESLENSQSRPSVDGLLYIDVRSQAREKMYEKI